MEKGRLMMDEGGAGGGGVGGTDERDMNRYRFSLYLLQQIELEGEGGEKHAPGDRFMEELSFPVFFDGFSYYFFFPI